MRTYSSSVVGLSVTLPINSIEWELTAKRTTKQKIYGGANNGQWKSQETDVPVYTKVRNGIQCGLGAVLFLAQQNPFIHINFESFEPERKALDEFVIPKGITGSDKWLVKGKERWYFREALQACRQAFCGTCK